MTPEQKCLAEEAVTRALRLRRRLGLASTDAVCPLDTAEKLGIEVRLIDLPSMEGLYISGRAPTILLSSLRPAGRRRFTCAHEIGHHVFSHGQRFDELIKDRAQNNLFDPAEFSADVFAAHFLMPRTAIVAGFRSRNSNSNSPLDVYAISGWLGVGYKTLVKHLQFGLQMINGNTANDLCRATPEAIRKDFARRKVSGNLYFVDASWQGRAVDCVVGDTLAVPKTTLLEGNAVKNISAIVRDCQLLVADKPGICRLSSRSGEWSAYVRASQADFIGRACYRFEETVG